MTISAPASKLSLPLAVWLGWLTALWLGPEGLAHAEGPERVIHWQAPRTCPDASAFERRLRQLDSAAAAASVEVVIQKTVGGYTLALRQHVGTQVEERRLDAAGCEALLEAAALIVSMSADAEVPDSGATPGVPTRPAPAGIRPQRRADALGVQEDVRGKTARREQPVAFEAFAAAGGIFDSGALPSPTAGFSGGFGLSTKRFTVEGRLVWLPRRAGTQQEARATLRLLAAQLRACARLWGQETSLLLCADAEGGALKGDVAGSEDRGGWGAVGPTALARFHLGEAWALCLTLGALRPWLRAQVIVRDDGTGLETPLHRPAAWSARAGLRTEVWF